MNNSSFGTDLSNAFSPLNGDTSYLDDQQTLYPNQQDVPPVQTRQQLPQQNVSVDNNDSESQKTRLQNQKLLEIISEMKRQKNMKKNNVGDATQSKSYDTTSDDSYLDKLFSKKRDLLKLIQWSLIILLALSLHDIIGGYIRNYISDNDFSKERDLFIRCLYPFSIIFVLWNLKVFVK